MVRFYPASVHINVQHKGTFFFTRALFFSVKKKVFGLFFHLCVTDGVIIIISSSSLQNELAADSQVYF